jgi:hypothetical protein
MLMQKAIFAVFALFLLLVGCSSGPSEKSKQPEKATTPAKTEPSAQPEYLTGRDAFQKLYIAARNWSPDSKPLSVESLPRKDDKRDGTASVWSARFASPQRGQVRSFMWSGAVGEGAPEPGITPGSQDTYSPGNASTQPFDPAYLQTDTDNGLKVADKHAPAEAKKDKTSPLKFKLFNDTSKQRLLWRVIYGPSEYNAKAVVDISARDGGFVKVEK